MRGDDLVEPVIPLDLQVEILTRLPAKSLMRFKCVSKGWSSLIRSRNFSNCYLTVASPPRPPRLYISFVYYHECESVLLSLSSSSSSAESFDLDLTMLGMGGRHMIALRGLFLYIVCGRACIYNPTTRQSVTLPAVNSNIFAGKGFLRNVFYFFGHDPILDQYKVICTVVESSEGYEETLEHWIFVLEAGGSWKRIEFEFYQPHHPTSQGLCINGVIYYVAANSMSPYIVVSFDVRSEEFNTIQAPHLLSAYYNLTGFIEYGGKLAIFDHTRLVQNGLVDLWVLEDAGQWSKKSLGLQLSQMHLVDHNISFVVQGTTKNGEVILVRPPIDILYYDLQKNDLRKVEIRGMWDYKFLNSCFFTQLMDKHENIMHLET